MSRFGSMTARFYARTALSTLLQDSEGVATRVPVSGLTEMNMSAEGRTELILARDEHLDDLAVAGRVVMVGQEDALAPTGFKQVPFCLPFLIEKVEDISADHVRLEGPDLLSLLKDVTTHEPIGTETVTATTVAVAVADPITTTVAVGAPSNNDSVTMADSTGWQVGDEARIELDGGAGTHVTVVTTVNPPGAPYAHTIQIRDRMPADASNGNTVERRRRAVQVATGTGVNFQTGMECRLVMDNGSTHMTVIEEDPEEDVIVMRDGAPDGAAVGKSVSSYDYSLPAMDDVIQIVENLTTALPMAWDVEFESGSYSGTAAGTYHAPQGDSIYDLLVLTSERSGEYFRLFGPQANLAPQLKVLWRRTFDYAGNGGNMRLVMPSQSDIDNELLNPNRGIIVGSVRRSGNFTPVTRVTPYAGDKRITLALCTEGAMLDALAVGMTIINSGLGTYTPPYLKNAAAETTWGPISRTLSFSNIRVETTNIREWQSAADSMLATAVNFLQEHGTGIRYQYEVEDVVSAVPILPGQRVELVYTAPDGSWSVNKTGANALYCTQVRARFEPPREEGGYLVGGVKLLTLTLMESPYDLPDIARATAGAINEVGRLARLGGGTTGSSSTTTVVTGGTASDHGALTGLNDDDHPRYLLADGTRTMTGDLVLETGKRVDGVDIDVHVADPAAHHAPVTSGNTGISVSGQSIGLALASPSALEIADGLRLAAAAVGSGLRLDSQVLSVRLANLSGLSLAGGALGLGTPGTLSAASTSAVTATGHTHLVDASSAPGASTRLLKSNSDGHLELRTLSIGTAADGASALKVMSPQANLYGLYLKQRSDQAAQMLRIESAAGAALLLVTNDGNLESGDPGFVSGLTGFQIQGATGNAEFNNVRVRGELHATTFVADELHATGGTIQVVTATNIADPYGAYDNELGPIDSAATTYITVNASWATGLSYFAQKDIIRIKSMGEVQSGGSLYIPDIYLEVVAVSAVGDRNLADGKPGRYALMCLRKSGGYEGYQIPTGSAVVLWTKSGQGTGAYKGNMLLTADLAQSPYLDVFTVDASRAYLLPWPGSGQTRTTPTIKPRVRVGNLDGVLGLPEQWGIAAGTDLSDTSATAKYIVASDLGVRLQNIELSMYSGSDRVLHLSPSGMTLLSSIEAFEYERSIRWQRSSGQLVAAVSALGDGTYTRLDIGASPTFNLPDMTENGLHIVHLLDRPHGDYQHRVDLMGWGVVTVDGGHSMRLVAPYITASPLRLKQGLVVGDMAATDAPAGAIRFKQKTTGVNVPPAGFADFYVVDDGSGQKLYIRFDNGTVRLLAQQ